LLLRRGALVASLPHIGYLRRGREGGKLNLISRKNPASRIEDAAPPSPRKPRASQRSPRIGPAIQAERKARKLTLEQLSMQSGVSKSMLSQIERGEANPTFAVVWSLTQALDIDFSHLVGAGSTTPTGAHVEVTSKAHTPEIRSADGLCRLKILSSPRLAGQTEWYEVVMQPGGRLDSAPHAAGASEHFTALADGFEIVCGDSVASVREGETARYPGDVPHSIANTGAGVARGLLVVLYR
jgi:XRE family transcriptional regulator, regulator of sulfur utilization